jgi:TRAP-type C4-dicarboxylate transport system permease small subunit
MSIGRIYLSALSGLERTACVFGFLVMAGGLIVDVGARLWSRVLAEAGKARWVSAEFVDQWSYGGGVLGAPQIAVIGMIIVSMFGLGVAIDKGAQLRARFLDGVFPQAWSGGIDRLADLITAIVFMIIGGLAAIMTREAFALGDVTSVLRWPIWPMQTIIAAAFVLNGLRHLVFCVAPELRPHQDIEPETFVVEEAPR